MEPRKQRLLEAIRNLDEEPLRKALLEYNPDIEWAIQDEENFWSAVHSLRYDTEYSGATAEQAAESKVWLMEHGGERLVKMTDVSRALGLRTCSIAEAMEGMGTP